MSTKKIREALDLMKEIQGHSTVDMHAGALAEVEAIEKAAKVVAIQGIYEAAGDGPEVLRDVEVAEETFHAIADEAKGSA